MLNKIKEFFRRPPEFLDSKVEEWDEIKRLGNEIAKELIDQHGTNISFERKVAGYTISNQDGYFKSRFDIYLEKLNFSFRDRGRVCRCRVGESYFKLVSFKFPKCLNPHFFIAYDDLLRIKTQLIIILEELR